MKSEDAPAVAAAVTYKTMKRLLTIALLLIMLTACAPNNVITSPEVQNPTTDTTDSPDESKPNETPDTPPATETPEQPVEDKSGIIFQSKKENTEVKPSYALDTTALKDKTVTLYTTEDGAFGAGGKSETEWFDALKETYGLTVKYSYKTKGSLRAAQSIATKSGIALDVITAPINDMASSLGLMQSAERFFAQTENALFSQTVYAQSGNRVFTAKGNSRMLWYNADLLGNSSPFELFKKDDLTTDALSATLMAVDKTKTQLIECSNWISFGSTGTVQATGIVDNAYTFTVTDPSSISTFADFAAVLTDDKNNNATEYSFNKGNTVFKLTSDAGKQEFKLGFAPIPKHGSDGTYVAELCGTGLGISKTATEENAQIAAQFINLWSARYTESRVDKLMKLLGYEQAEKYIEATETYGKLTNTDAQIAQLFEGTAIPAALYGAEDVVYNSFASGYTRAAVINR